MKKTNHEDVKNGKWVFIVKNQWKFIFLFWAIEEIDNNYLIFRIQYVEGRDTIIAYLN